MESKERGLSLYELSTAGRALEQMFLQEEIDEETLKGSQDLLVAEIEGKGNSLVQIYNNFVNYLGQGTGQNKIVGAIDREIDRLKKIKEFYKSRFDKFSNKVADTMLSCGVQSGQSNGIQTENGSILYLYKSNREIKPNPEEVIDKYKIYKFKPFQLSFDEYISLPDELKQKLQIGEVTINKDLYQQENGTFKKEEHYTLKIK